MQKLQNTASDPQKSIWLAASAGTGKTKVLIDRLLRLLLQNVNYKNILCLTFTNAAANEMKERIYEMLSYWASLNSNDLQSVLTSTLGSPPTKTQQKKASNLYTEILFADDPLNIATIHAFAKQILKTFPIEAGIQPNFKIIGDEEVSKIILHIKQIFFASSKLKIINQYFAKNCGDHAIDEIFDNVIFNRIKFIFGKKNNIENLDIEHIIHELEINFHSYERYKAIASEMKLESFFEDQGEKSFKEIFLTKDGNKRKNISKKRLPEGYVIDKEKLLSVQDVVNELDQALKIQQLDYYSRLINYISYEIIDLYDNYKQKNQLLDYNDLILKLEILLTTDKIQDIICNKFEGGIQHVLVDEAQDTSILQWNIIEKLVSNFHKDNASLFVVGDDKQSIFSFQGADIVYYHSMYKKLSSKLLSIGHSFEKITLNTSFRSSEHVIGFVHEIFDELRTQSKFFLSDIPQMNVFRKQIIENVEIWPLVKVEKQDTPAAWSIDHLTHKSFSSKTQLAEKISEFIHKTIIDGKILRATGQKVKAGDFMLLFRKRDEFTVAVIDALHKKNLPTTGLDRIKLKDNLAVRDLLAIASFVLNSKNDLNLASLLKSPIFMFTEDELQTLLMNRGSKSLWEYFCDQIQLYKNTNEQIYFNKYIETHKELLLFIKFSKECNVGNFFTVICDALSYRELIRSKYDIGSEDAVNELIYYSSKYARQNSNLSLQEFVWFLEKYSIDIKRELESGDSIKIMTVHASKGLQAPIVILCDTTNIPSNKEKFIFDMDYKLFCIQKVSNAPEKYKILRDEQQNKIMQEYFRLLYVALTRAEDKLIICGYSSERGVNVNSWYTTVTNILSYSKNTNIVDNNIVYFIQNTLNKEEAITPKSTSEKKEINTLPAIEDILLNKSKIYNLIKKANFDTVQQKNIYDNLNSLQYGEIFHLLLQDYIKAGLLFDIMQHSIIKHLDYELKNRIHNSIVKLKKNKDFFQLLSAGEAKTEVNFNFVLDNGGYKSGRIDLLIINRFHVIIVDYKSDLNIYDLKKIPVQYLSQLSYYKAAMQKIYPSHNITCRILWLEEGVFSDEV